MLVLFLGNKLDGYQQYTQISMLVWDFYIYFSMKTNMSKYGTRKINLFVPFDFYLNNLVRLPRILMDIYFIKIRGMLEKYWEFPFLF